MLDRPARSVRERCWSLTFQSCSGGRCRYFVGHGHGISIDIVAMVVCDGSVSTAMVGNVDHLLFQLGSQRDATDIKFQHISHQSSINFNLLRSTSTSSAKSCKRHVKPDRDPRIEEDGNVAS